MIPTVLRLKVDKGAASKEVIVINDKDAVCAAIHYCIKELVPDYRFPVDDFLSMDIRIFINAIRQ